MKEFDSIDLTALPIQNVRNIESAIRNELARREQDERKKHARWVIEHVHELLSFVEHRGTCTDEKRQSNSDCLRCVLLETHLFRYFDEELEVHVEISLRRR